jgi:hypothetical protein
MQPEKPYSGKYKPHDKFIVFNDNDEDLYPIRYELPDPPPLQDIDGYGLQFKDQFFQRPAYSRKLLALIKKPGLSSSKFETLEKDQDFYEDEIKFIQREWTRYETGYWFFNNGKPTYLTGLNYFFLTLWQMLGPADGRPSFRMSDREAFLFIKMCEDDPYCGGFNWPKGRRYGATSLISCWRYFVAIMGKGKHVGLQSKTEDDAQVVHEFHISYAWRKMPFWASPIFDSKLDSKNKLRFFAPQVKSHPDYEKEALESWIDYENSNEKAYDSQILHALHNDELGKNPEIDIKKRIAVQRPCLEMGQEFRGLMANTSTVDEMDAGGGQQFKDICDQSHYQNRDKTTGRTASALYNFFIPDDEGTLGKDPDTGKSFIDKYGFCETALIRKKLLAERKQLRDDGDIAGAIEKTRQHPLYWKECWLRSAENCLFDLAVIEYVLDKYRHGNADVRVGRFEWEHGIPDTKVVWRDDPLGPFKVSYLFEEPKFSNAQHIDGNGIRWPRNTQRFVAGGDTFKNRETKQKRKSNGGGAVLWKMDHTVDHPNTLPEHLKSNRFICTYNFRPKTPEIFAEDMLMMCVYYGCEIFPELNVTTIWDHFETRGYAGYLFYRTDAKNRLSVTPGAQMSEKLKEDIFYAYQIHISKNGRRERHPEILQECKDIEGPEYMTDYDLFTAGGCALVAARKSIFNPNAKPVTDTNHVDDYFQVYEYPD